MKKHWRVCIRRWASKKPVRAGTGRDFPRYMQVQSQIQAGRTPEGKENVRSRCRIKGGQKDGRCKIYENA